MKPDFTFSRDSLAGLNVFRQVATRGSFRAAADFLGVSPSAVSQSLQTLEARLQTRLIQRTSRQVGLTDAGARFLAEIGPALDRVDAAAEQLQSERGQPTGLLRLNSSDLAAELVLAPVLADFLARHPLIQVEVFADSSLSGLAGGGFDAGLRFGVTLEQDMVALPLSGRLEWGLYATPAYFSRHPEPKRPQDLLGHDCIRFRLAGSGRVEHWPLQRALETLKVAVTGRLIYTDQRMTLDACLRGLGLSRQLASVAEPHVSSGALREVMRPWRWSGDALYLYYPSRHHVAPRLRALIDFLSARQGKPAPVRARRPRS